VEHRWCVVFSMGASIGSSVMGIAAPRRSLPAPTVTSLLAVAVLAAVPGCSAKSGSGSDTLTALQHLRAEANASEQVTYVDSARIRQLSKTDTKRFTIIGQPASGLWHRYWSPPWGQSLKVSQIDSAVDSTVAGHWEGSFDEDAITASLKKNGYTSAEENGTGVWKPSSGAGPTMTVSKNEINYVSGSGSVVAADSSPGDSLADKKEYREAAGCLGDVYRADFNSLATSDAVRLTALGQQANSSAKNTEVLCAVVRDRATADRIAAKLRSVVADKAPKYDGTEVTIDEGDRPVVRAAVPDTSSQRPGRLFTDFDLFIALEN
jgi:hypothetical protein